MNPQQEKALIKSAKAGDREALSALWDGITPKLFGYLMNVTRDTALSEDILQTTWLKAVQNLHKYESRGGGISAWLFAIARNECRQHWRKTKHETPFDDSEHDRAGNDNETIENKLLVDQILNFLSEDDRELLRLRYIADLSQNEIAKILNINFVAVRVRIHRALARARIAINNPNV